MTATTTGRLFFSGVRSTDETGLKPDLGGLGLLLEVNDVIRCKRCLIAVQHKDGVLRCSECHKFRDADRKDD